MADESNEEKTPAKGGNMMAILLAGALGGLTGVVGALVAGPMLNPPSAEALPAAAAEATAEEVAAFSDRLLSLDPFVVNITGEGYPRYLKIKVAFEVSSIQGRADLEDRVAQIRDLTILLLSSKRLADVTDFEGKALLKDDLRDRVNGLVETRPVQSVLFTEFVVQ